MTAQDRFSSGIVHMRALLDLAVWYDRGSYQYVADTGKLLMNSIRDDLGPITMADLSHISTADICTAACIVTSLYSDHLSMLQYLNSLQCRIATLELWALVFDAEIKRRGVSC